jgi:hypothetical protein
MSVEESSSEDIRTGSSTTRARGAPQGGRTGRGEALHGVSMLLRGLCPASLGRPAEPTDSMPNTSSHRVIPDDSSVRLSWGRRRLGGWVCAAQRCANVAARGARDGSRRAPGQARARPARMPRCEGPRALAIFRCRCKCGISLRMARPSPRTKRSTRAALRRMRTRTPDRTLGMDRGGGLREQSGLAAVGMLARNISETLDPILGVSRQTLRSSGVATA